MSSTAEQILASPEAAGQDMSPVVPVVLMDGVRGSLTSEAVGGSAAGDLPLGTP